MYSFRSYQPFIDFLLTFKNPLVDILIGAVFTALIQSSSALTGILISPAQQGVLSLEAAIPLLFGANIGTCITAILAEMDVSREAKRVATAHTLFKVGGVLIFVWFIGPLASLIRMISPDAPAELTQLYCAWPETALLAKCEDKACQGPSQKKSAILTDVEYSMQRSYRDRSPVRIPYLMLEWQLYSSLSYL